MELHQRLDQSLVEDFFYSTGLARIGEINTYSPLFAFFRCDDDVSQPIWVVEFSDDADFDELSYLFLYDLQPFWGELLSFLED